VRDAGGRLNVPVTTDGTAEIRGVHVAVHPAADVFPLLVGAEFDRLVDDIEAHGLRLPIVLDVDGRILDGRNRHRACEAAGVEPRFETWAGDAGSEIAYVVSANLTRRHMNASQRALVAAKLATLRHGGDRVSEQAANLQVAPTQAEAATMLNVSERTVASAREVLDHGAPELVAAVERGHLAVSTAADVAELPKAAQAAIVALSNTEIIGAAKTVRSERAAKRHARRAGVAPPSNGMQFARIAIMKLDEIGDDDLERTAAFALVRRWLDARTRGVEKIRVVHAARARRKGPGAR
jgi:hypothetical protein